MKETPILFSAAMVRAILGGRKTVTRRTVRPQPDIKRTASGVDSVFWSGGPALRRAGYGANYVHTDVGAVARAMLAICPYGKAGDILWVRETHYRFGHWEKLGGKRTKGGREKWAFRPDIESVLFEPPEGFLKSRDKKKPNLARWYKRLARFMPRKLSRIMLRIESVSVEQLQSITADEAANEGVAYRVIPSEDPKKVIPLFPLSDPIRVRHYPKPKKEPITHERMILAEFASVWEEINGAGSWDYNPFVYAVRFSVL